MGQAVDVPKGMDKGMELRATRRRLPWARRLPWHTHSMRCICPFSTLMEPPTLKSVPSICRQSMASTNQHRPAQNRRSRPSRHWS